MNDIFERYYEYLEPQTEVDKEQMLEDFKRFLEYPEAFGGFFVIRWLGNEELSNTKKLNDFVKTVK